MSFIEFEDLLNRYEEISSKKEESAIQDSIHECKLLKADKNASMYDFIKMIDKIVTLTMGDLNVSFIPDEGNISFIAADKKLDNPVISYKLKSRKPKGEIKPRFRENFVEKDNEGYDRIGEVYGQKFQCHIQFNVFASVYSVAEQVMERFEELMLTYAGFFKKNGVSEIIFDQQYTDDNFEKLRQTLSIRNICYYVEIEKLTVIMRESIKEIDIY